MIYIIEKKMYKGTRSDETHSVTPHLASDGARGRSPTARVKLQITERTNVSFGDVEPSEHKERC